MQNPSVQSDLDYFEQELRTLQKEFEGVIEIPQNQNPNMLKKQLEIYTEWLKDYAKKMIAAIEQNRPGVDKATFESFIWERIDWFQRDATDYVHGLQNSLEMTQQEQKHPGSLIPKTADREKLLELTTLPENARLADVRISIYQMLIFFIETVKNLEVAKQMRDFYEKMHENASRSFRPMSPEDKTKMQVLMHTISSQSTPQEIQTALNKIGQNVSMIADKNYIAEQLQALQQEFEGVIQNPQNQNPNMLKEQLEIYTKWLKDYENKMLPVIRQRHPGADNAEFENVIRKMFDSSLEHAQNIVGDHLKRFQMPQQQRPLQDEVAAIQQELRRIPTQQQQPVRATITMFQQSIQELVQEFKDTLNAKKEAKEKELSNYLSQSPYNTRDSDEAKNILLPMETFQRTIDCIEKKQYLNDSQVSSFLRFLANKKLGIQNYNDDIYISTEFKEKMTPRESQNFKLTFEHNLQQFLKQAKNPGTQTFSAILNLGGEHFASLTIKASNEANQLNFDIIYRDSFGSNFYKLKEPFKNYLKGQIGKTFAGASVNIFEQQQSMQTDGHSCGFYASLYAMLDRYIPDNILSQARRKANLNPANKNIIFFNEINVFMRDKMAQLKKTPSQQPKSLAFDHGVSRAGHKEKGMCNIM